jgi:hypothetical protein
MKQLNMQALFSQAVQYAKMAATALLLAFVLLTLLRLFGWQPIRGIASAGWQETGALIAGLAFGISKV